jgi:hypothetical protein
MTKNRAIFTLFTLILTIIAVTASSCITLVDKKVSGDKSGISVPQPITPGEDNPPNVTAFSASATEINAGQPLTFSYTVADDIGLTRVELWRLDETAGVKWREISRVSISGKNFSGTVSDTPTAPGTYSYGIHVVDTAEKWNSEANSETNSKPGVYGPKKVVLKGADRPELVITDIQLVTRDVYYKTKNTGTAASKGCRANLYVNGIKQADDYIEVLAPGEERLSNFSNYSFPYLVGDLPQTQFYELMRQFTIKVCADVENVVVENDESNNCKSVIWGQKFAYKFVDFSHQARWTTGYGVLKLPLPEDSATGSARVEYQTLEDNQGYGAALLTVPQQVNDGWIQGEFGEFYADELRQTRVREVTIPDMAMFTARVGFSSSTPKDSKAKFMFGTVDQSGRATFATPAVTATMDGKVQEYTVDLSSLAGQKRMFVLRVEVIGPAAKVRPVWVDPRISQP